MVIREPEVPDSWVEIEAHIGGDGSAALFISYGENELTDDPNSADTAVLSLEDTLTLRDFLNNCFPKP